MLAPREGGQDHQARARESQEPFLRVVAGAQAVPAEIAALSPKIAAYLDSEPLDEPCLVVDVDLVGQAYLDLAQAFDGARVHYAVKANPEEAIIARVLALGSAFDCASIPEIRHCLQRGAAPSSIGYGNTIKKERDIAAAFALGVRLFAFDSEAELAKIARAAPGATVQCRIFSDGAGADWPLSRKFGCGLDMAEYLMIRAHAMGLDAAGLSFHVGSQQTDPESWTPMLAQVSGLFARLEAVGLPMRLLNLGGGMPAHYDKPVAGIVEYGAAVMRATRVAFASRSSGLPLALMVEPGRGLVGNAGVIQAEVVLVSRKAPDDEKRWVYLDIGKFSGLAETMDEAIKYRFLTARDGEATGPVVLAGPSCDSADVLYEKTDYRLPLGLKAGDGIWIMGAGAYTATYASVGFNGFPPLRSICL